MKGPFNVAMLLFLNVLKNVYIETVDQKHHKNQKTIKRNYATYNMNRKVAATKPQKFNTRPTTSEEHSSNIRATRALHVVHAYSSCSNWFLSHSSSIEELSCMVILFHRATPSAQRVLLKGPNFVLLFNLVFIKNHLSE